MKKYRIWKFIVILVFMAQLGACSSGSSSNGTENKINGFYFSFDETGQTVIDHSGNGFNGKLASILRVPGKIGTAAQFLGSGSIIELEEIQDYFPYDTGFTFMAWLQTGVNPYTQQQIIGSTYNREPGSEGDGFGIAIAGSRIVFELPEDPDFLFTISPDLSFQFATWFHIAVTYDGENLSYFYNGDLVATDTVVTKFKPGFYNHIGNMQDAEDSGLVRNQFVETIDELYLENRVRSHQEIMNYYLETM